LSLARVLFERAAQRLGCSRHTVAVGDKRVIEREFGCCVCCFVKKGGPWELLVEVGQKKKFLRGYGSE
jgi:hypothetical protein